MEFATTLEAYARVGVLGLCAVVLIMVFVLLIKKLLSSNDSKDKSVQSQNDKLLEIITNQNNNLMSQFYQHNEQMLDEAVNKIITHVPSLEDNNKQTKISDQIDKCLQEILIQTNASRASLVQYHNGGSGVNKQRFLKMSMTNEQVQLGVKPIMTEFRDQFRSVISYFVRCIGETGKCYIEDTEDVKTIDSSLYEFLSDRNIKSKFGVSVQGMDGYVYGFICIEYLKEKPKNIKNIEHILTEYKITIQTLLNM